MLMQLEHQVFNHQLISVRGLFQSAHLFEMFLSCFYNCHQFRLLLWECGGQVVTRYVHWRIVGRKQQKFPCRTNPPLLGRHFENMASESLGWVGLRKKSYQDTLCSVQMYLLDCRTWLWHSNANNTMRFTRYNLHPSRGNVDDFLGLQKKQGTPNGGLWKPPQKSVATPNGLHWFKKN